MTKLRSLQDLGSFVATESPTSQEEPVNDDAPRTATVPDPDESEFKPDAGSAYPIKVSRVSRFDGQPRKFFSDHALGLLADSIQANGQQIPVIVCRGEEPGRFILVDGERRWRACNLIYNRTGVEPVILANVVVVKSVRDHFRKSMIANLHREDLSPLDEAAALSYMKQEHTLGSLADMIGKSTTYVDNYIRLHSLPDDVKALMSHERPKDRRLSVTAAIDIVRGTKDPQLQFDLAREAIDRSLSLGEVRTLVSTKAGGLLRAGITGYGYGEGRYRKPSDDYRSFNSFLARMRGSMAKLLRVDFENIYRHRDDDLLDRRIHMREIDNALIDLRELEAKLLGVTVDSPWRNLDVLKVQDTIASFTAMREAVGAGDDHPNR